MINKKYGLKIPATKVYDYPNLQAFTAFGEEEVNQHGDVALEQALPVSTSADLSLDEILELVQKRVLDIEEADQLIEELNLKQEGGGES